MRRQTVHHLISTVIPLPLLIYAGLFVLAEPTVLDPWRKQWVELWPMLWLMLLTGAVMLTNGMLGLLALRKRVGKGPPPVPTAPAGAAEKDVGRRTPAAPGGYTDGRGALLLGSPPLKSSRCSNAP
jgi:hypothetical protein